MGMKHLSGLRRVPFTHTDKETERQTDRETERQRDRQHQYNGGASKAAG